MYQDSPALWVHKYRIEWMVCRIDLSAMWHGRSRGAENGCCDRTRYFLPKIHAECVRYLPCHLQQEQGTNVSVSDIAWIVCQYYNIP